MQLFRKRTEKNLTTSEINFKLRRGGNKKFYFGNFTFLFSMITFQGLGIGTVTGQNGCYRKFSFPFQIPIHATVLVPSLLVIMILSAIAGH